MNNVWKLYAIRFFQSLIPAYVIERLFWEARGMSIQEVVYTEIIFAVTIILLEIPTGVLADKWSRKRLLVLGAVLACSEFAILLFATEFWHFAAVVCLAGLGNTFVSGSETALLYDSLQAHGKENRFEKVIGRLNAFDAVSATLAALGGSLLAHRFGYELNYILSLASAAVALLAALTLQEPPFKKEDAEAAVPMSEYVRASLLFFRHNPGVSLVVLTGMVTGSAIGFIDEFWQIYAERLGVPVLYFGLLSAAFLFLRLPGNLLAHALLRRFSYRALFLCVSAVFTLGFFLISIWQSYAGLAAILVVFLFSGIVDPLASGYLHHRIDSSMRATMDSFQSLGLYGVHSLIGLGFGYYSSKLDIFGGFGFIAVLCGAFFAYFWFASKAAAVR
ncbi:MFS transporter [Paenibacillus sp. N4]|uniref:MFS transporter n=1 Tax=Paenibacillus vietnamensis TaxID=2590547 RepID=UPI001CD15C66|nr:MFS transporter [Paenibacillus vietnamensis]MCA0757473.1 MFS transporter [Paenibacillus vietnamensis]